MELSTPGKRALQERQLTSYFPKRFPSFHNMYRPDSVFSPRECEVPAEPLDLTGPLALLSLLLLQRWAAGSAGGPQTQVLQGSLAAQEIKIVE